MKILWLVLATALSCPAGTFSFSTVMVPMRDSVALATDIYRPEGAGKHPVLVYRSPYGRGGAKGDATYLAARGYVVVAQDVRGRFDSHGSFYPFLNEGPDGYDTIEWAARQPWSNGKVGTFGASYLAWDQYLAAMERPPHLVAMFTLVGGANFYREYGYPGGIPNLGWPIWLVKSAQTSPQAARREAQRKALSHILEDPAEWLKEPPAQRGAVFDQFPDQKKAYEDFLAHPELDRYWKQPGFYNFDSYRKFADVPMLFLTGWYDYFSEGVVDNFGALSKRQKTEKKLIIGPWPHGTGANSCGDAFFGTSAGVDQDAMMADWFDHWMKGASYRLLDEAPVRYFRMGGGGGERTAKNKLNHGGAWQSASTWPPTQRRLNLYFTPNGLLAQKRPAETTPIRYPYDPANPVPTIGGRYGVGGWSPNCAQDQVCSPKYLGCDNSKPLNQRPDVLSFATAPFEKGVAITGIPLVHLRISSDARDTDFTAKLIDVYPNGYAMIVGQGQLRARYREGFDKVRWLKPGEPAELEFTLGITSNWFAPGHKLRIDISSSDYPRLEPNPLPAHNSVFVGGSKGSWVELPIE
ncbi:MAG TPA: CocE/NonD family hydrolase [Bryobacteraceae bacterium]|jgi:putative CocE/NonD family hydrolase|nr:CocE/NonD family hydrolase [Bryobacteraceae bacterium]